MNPSGTNVINNSATRRSLPRFGRKSITFVPAAAAAAILAGCASSHPAGPSGPQTVTIRATDDFRFVPATVTVHTGKVRITLTDAGAYPHNISFPALHVTSASVSGSPGQTSTTFLLTFATPGRYSFVCTYHSTAGMKGQLVVLKRP